MIAARDVVTQPLFFVLNDEEDTIPGVHGRNSMQNLFHAFYAYHVRFHLFIQLMTT